MIQICRLLRQVRLEPLASRIQPTLTPIQPVRPLSVSLVVESRIEKKWTQRRMKKHQHDRIRKKRLDEFQESEQYRYEKSLVRKKQHVDNVWRAYGLKEAPPALTNQEKEKLMEKYVEQGVFNEPLSMMELYWYQKSSPSNSSWYQKFTPRIWRHKYRGIANPIPLERMINPSTGQRFRAGTIRKYQTKRYLWEKRETKRLGWLNHERGRHSHGWVSLRDTRDTKHIERGMPLPKWTSKMPSTFAPIDRKQQNLARQKHFHVLNGYFDDDFVTPWRHFALNTNQDVASTQFSKLPVYNKHYCHGWSNPENFKFHEFGAMQRTRKSYHTGKTKHLKSWRDGRPKDE